MGNGKVMGEKLMERKGKEMMSMEGKWEPNTLELGIQECGNQAHGSQKGGNQEPCNQLLGNQEPCNLLQGN